ncbi:hypothetical protein [Actinoplanes sp. NPDC051851]|uniref:hypothetical protein n=1 Tax=Actinoplanes sp. NPDC051851 TaxID=3154753 RepID=UPI003423B6BE
MPLIVFVDANVPCPADPNDRHVLAAAVGGKVDVLVTREREGALDFQRCLDQVDAGTTVLHVDDCLLMLADRHPALVRARYRDQIRYHRARLGLGEETAADLTLERLEKNGAERFAFRLRTDERFRVWGGSAGRESRLQVGVG